MGGSVGVRGGEAGVAGNAGSAVEAGVEAGVAVVTEISGFGLSGPLSAAAKAGGGEAGGAH